MSGKRLAIDVGGTFIDMVLLDEATGTVTTEKEPSVIGAGTDNIFRGVERLGVNVNDLEMIIHGSTVVINTILQERGANIGIITTEGFRDVLQLGRGSRPEVYNLLYKPQKPLVPRYLRFGVPERMGHKGDIITPLDEAATIEVIKKLKARNVEGIGVCFLHSYSNPTHEQRVRELINEVYPEAHVSISSDITGEWREFERTSTVAMNTYVMPRMSAYVGDLEDRLNETGFDGILNIIQSTGGMVAAEEARRLPIRTLESGPAGGIMGAVGLGEKIGQPNLIASDVGGTSFDVGLVLDGKPSEKSQTYVNKRPVLQPTVDIISVGAGGGSIAWIDESGAFRVGPQSAEADPGPVCYGKGGTEPTVTDAHLVLGRINPNNFLGQRMAMDVEGAKKAITEKIADPLGLTLEQAAHGITRLADISMINAIRHMTIERGHDPRDFALLCYGGGGGLFAAPLAEELQIKQTIIPINPAVFSAWGILNSDYREDAVVTSVEDMADMTVENLLERFDALSQSCLAKMGEGGLSTEAATLERFADIRYDGQEHTVTVPLPTDAELNEHGLQMLTNRFDEYHERAYAHALPGAPTQLVNIRVTATVEASKPAFTEVAAGSGDGKAARKDTRQVYFEETGYTDCAIYDRSKLGAGDTFTGPAIIEEWNSTIIMQPNQTLEVDAYGNLVINTGGAA
ncbi:MAG: hydantoinase/oxoprolinase family protein [Chloroflexota bacterium]